MKTFYLLSKQKDIISKTDAYDIEDAIDTFSVIKNLSKEKLLMLFIITDRV